MQGLRRNLKYEQVLMSRKVNKERKKIAIHTTIGVLILVLIILLLCPIYKVYTESMTPTLNEGNLVVTVRTHNVRPGKVAIVDVEGKKLAKRCIAGENQTIDIEEDGIVKVDGEAIEELYLAERARGEIDVKIPLTVPEDEIFVLGDHRSASLDSRIKSIGCIKKENVEARVILCIWPIKDFGPVH